MSNVYDYKCQLNDGSEKLIGDYKDEVLLIVNTASQCGFTKQYKGLEDLYQSYGSKGFKVLGFPCNQFGQQEPEGDDKIAQFCELNFGVTFPLFKKIDVNGENASPLFEYLKGEARGIIGTKSIKWNFTKFLINREGKVLKRFSPTDKPESIKKDIEALL